MLLRVRAPGRVVPPTVVLYPAGDEWECDCPSRVNPCEHVAAAAIALGPQETGSRPAPLPAAEWAHVGYRFTRGEGELRLARALVAPDGTETPLVGPLTALLADPARAARVQVEEADLHVDRLLALGPAAGRGVLPPTRLEGVLRILAGAKRVTLDGRPGGDLRGGGAAAGDAGRRHRTGGRARGAPHHHRRSPGAGHRLPGGGAAGGRGARDAPPPRRDGADRPLAAEPPRAAHLRRRRARGSSSPRCCPIWRGER